MNLTWFPGGTKLLIDGPAGPGISGIWTLATISHEIRKIQDNVGGVALAPDGSRIIFERDQNLWQMGPSGESPTRLVEAGYSNCSGLSWSPDGRWLTYIRRTGDTDPSVLEARLAENGRIATILKDSNLRGYVWLSATRIVLNRWEAPDKPYSNLWQIDVDPKEMKAIGAARRLTNWAGFSVESLSASRDGKLLAFNRETDRSNIFIGRLTEGENSLSQPRRLSPEDRVEWPNAWGPDSETLFFQSDRAGNMNIYRQNINSTSAEPVVIEQSDNRASALSPDKSWAIYFEWPRSSSHASSANLMRRLVGGGTSELILEAKAEPTSPQNRYWVILPTMTGQPAFRCPWRAIRPCVLSESGSGELVFYSFVPIPSTLKSELFRVHADDPNSIAWDLSPDGLRIVYAQYDWKSASIHVRELSTQTVRDIPLKGLTELSTVSWAADGKSLFATTFAVTGSSLFHIALDGKYHVLYKGAKEVEGARPSPDGRYLAFGDVVSASNVWLVEGLPK